jgi:hypothetical protein
MSKVSNPARIECLKIWIENLKFRSKKQPVKQSSWVKKVYLEKDEN